MRGEISLTNQANQHDGFENTQEFQMKAAKDREQKDRMGRETAAKLTLEFVEKVIQAHRNTLREAEYHYQVTFCETKYSHRYINFEIEADQKEAVTKILDQFCAHTKQW